MDKLTGIYDKVRAGGYAGLVTTLVVGLLGLAHITLAAPLVALIVTAIIFGAGYLTTETKVGRELAPLADDVWKAVQSEGPVQKGQP